MSSLLSIAGALAGPLFGGAGAVKQNRENQQTKEELDARGAGLRGIVDPIQAGLLQGWSPGGFLRKASASQGVGEATGAMANETAAANNNAWRYGGGTSGTTRGGREKANQRRFLRTAEAFNTADLQGMDQLSRIWATIEGANNAFPVDMAQNPYAGYAQGANEFNAQLQQNNVL